MIVHKDLGHFQCQSAHEVMRCLKTVVNILLVPVPRSQALGYRDSSLGTWNLLSEDERCRKGGVSKNNFKDKRGDYKKFRD